MKKFLIILNWSFLFLLLLTGCSQNSEDKAADSRDYEKADSNVIDAQNEIGEIPATDSKTVKENSGQAISNNDRLVIYNGNLSLKVKDYHNVEKHIQSKAAELGGYVVESSIYDSGTDYINGTIIVKIPQKHFQTYLNDIEKKSIKVTEKSITGNDVTEEYVDLESRLKAKEAVEKRLLALMEQAEKTEDLLKISNDLATVQAEKEQILGRMKYLKNNVDYSTVTIQLEEELVKVGSIQDKESLNTWEKAKSQFVSTINGLISFLSSVIVMIVGLSPILIPVVVIVIAWIIYRKKKNRSE